MYSSSSSDKSLITVSMKPGQQGRAKTVRDNADDSLTSTLGVGGRPLIAGFCLFEEQRKHKKHKITQIENTQTEQQQLFSI